jgi:hypothetical protein
MASALLGSSVDRTAQLHILNNNVLAHETAYLEPARVFRRDFDNVLMGFRTAYPARGLDYEVVVLETPPQRGSAARELAEDWTIVSRPLLLRASSLSRTTSQI